MTPDARLGLRSPLIVHRMAEAAVAFHDALDARQREQACLLFEDNERFEWI